MKNNVDSEEDTKNQFITPALSHAGWKKTSMLMEYSLRSDKRCIVPGQNKTTKKSPKGPNKPDYILCYTPNCPLAVVEAKRSGLDDYEGLDQAKRYAKILNVQFAYSSSGREFVEWNAFTGEERRIPLNQFPSPEVLWKRWCKHRQVKKTDRKSLSNALYYTSANGWTPRYYQMKAINRAVEAVIVDHRKRCLLCMATGTGKTYTAFQIVWRLKKSGVIKNVLYLADRNQLIDQSLAGDFQPFANVSTKIQHGKIDTSYEIYFGLYQQFAGDEDGDAESTLDNLKQVPQDYFDLIIVDECHRGSAREESSWRVILEYFASAIQIGMTATPNTAEGAKNADYFGDPIFTYSLKEGIEDGFLAPYQVISVHLDKDKSGWKPEEGEKDDLGQILPQKTFTLDDFGQTLELKQRTALVAKVVTDYLKHIGRYSKTIVFCTTQNHALKMVEALRACNQDVCRESPNYAVRMTANDANGISLLDEFVRVDSKIPVIATTSKLLSTGVDTKCVKLIVLDTGIRSMTEFKQIIGRGTRLREDAGKTFFTIMDFRGVCELFKDSDFDGPADYETDFNPDKDTFTTGQDPEPQAPKPKNKRGGHTTGEPPKYFEVGRVSVELEGKETAYLDEDGKLVTEKFEDYTRKNILKMFNSEAEFVELWNGGEEKKAILARLEKEGILIEQIRKELGDPDIDEFDLILKIAFGHPPMTRQMRANRVKQSKFLDKYQGIAREVLDELLQMYARLGVTEIDSVRVLQNEPINRFGGVPRIIQEFGGRNQYLDAVRAMEQELYAPLTNP